MKKSLFILSFLWLGMFAFSQAPTGINYQTVIRDGDGQAFAHTGLTLKMTIRSGAPDGGAVYVETHAVVSNAFGLVNLVVGQGTPLNSDFATIAWGKSAFYLETAVDLTGGGQFQVLGVTQFLSVPYSLFSGQAGGILSMTNQERDALQNPPVGMQIYNSTTNCLNYFSGYDWYETCGNLILNQPPDMPFAVSPPDGATNLMFDFNLEWGCVDPENDPMIFDVYFGFENPPPLVQGGVNATTYFVSQLQFGATYFWKIVAHDNHNNFTQGNVWSFQTMNCLIPQVYAGENATICGSEVYQLSGVVQSPNATLGGWTTSGDGTFSNPSIPNPVYIPGILDVQNGYAVLTLTAYAAEPCPPFPGYDDMTLILQPYPEAYAGLDQTVCEGDWVYMAEAFASNYSQVQWFTPTGAGTFHPANEPYTQYWPSPIDWVQGCIYLVINAAPLTPCIVVATDSLKLCFNQTPTANAGPDQLNINGTTATLAGNAPPTGGVGQWIIQSGTGGNIAQPNNPNSTFTGLAGNSYTIEWGLYSPLACFSGDYVTISFASGFVCGTSTVNDVDGNVYNTVQEGSQCWMKQNLKTTKYRNGTSITYPGSNNTNWQNNTTGAYAWYNNDIANKTTYGALYNWYAVANTNNLCPTGWHVPTDAQWTALTDYVSSQTAYRCNSNSTYIAKSLAATTNWTTNTGTCTIGNNLAANNATGFTGLPGGYRNTGGTFGGIGNYGDFWSSTQDSAPYAWYRYLLYDYALVGRSYYTKGYGFSVRCVRD